MSGFTKSHRSKWQHPIFRDLLEAAIWAWMCDTAAWKDTSIRFNGELVKLRRGQLVTSVRFISQGFRIGEQVTRTFMQNLENDGMTNTLPTHRGTIITICNYDKYQQNENADNTQSNTQLTNSQHTANTNKKEVKKKRTKETTLAEWESVNGELALDMVPRFVERYGVVLSPKYLEKFRNSCFASGRKYVDFSKALQAWDWEEPKKKTDGVMIV